MIWRCGFTLTLLNMKKHVFSLAVFALAATLLVGCQDVVYPIWDFPPWDIGIVVRNSAGEDLLDPETVDNILDNDVTAVYDNRIYEMWDARTRWIRPEWFGLRVGKYWYDDENGDIALLFGQFAPDPSGHHGEIVIIDWGDGTSNEIKFDLYVTYRKKGKEATVHRKIWLDGKLQSDSQLAVEIVK